MGLLGAGQLPSDTRGGERRIPRGKLAQNGFDPVQGLGYTPPACRPGARMRGTRVEDASSRVAASTMRADETTA